MTFSDAFREGFRLMNRNWQLVAFQILATILYFSGFIVMVLLPVVVAAFAVGVDLASLGGIESIYPSLGEMIGRYAAVIVLAVVCLLVYITVVSVIAIFVFGASSGTIGESILNTEEKFSAKRFFGNGKRLFLPFLSYLTIAGLFLILLVLVIAAVVVGAVALVAQLKEMNMVLAVFAGIFAALFLIAVVTVGLTASIAVIFYGAAEMVFRGTRAWASIRKAAAFLYHRPSAYGLYWLLLLCSLGVTVAIVLIGLPFSMIPFIGIMIAIPLQIASLVVQSYVGLFITAVMFIYYFRTEVTDGGATAEIGIAVQEAAGQGPTPLQ